MPTIPAYELGFELFELLPDAILAVDRRGIIRYANRRAGELFGQEPAAFLLTPVEPLVPEYLRERHVGHRTKYTAEPRMRPMGAGLDLVACRADGTTVPVDIMLAPLTHLAEPIVLAVVRDVTDRRSAEKKLQLALEAARLGWWRYDLHGAVSGDARFKEIFEVTVDKMQIEDLKKLVHPDDAERFWVERESSFDPAVDPQRSAHEYRVLRRDGEVRWVEVHRLVHFEGAGRERRAANVVATVQDITERKQHEEQIQLLMREAGHRAKNLLTVVDAIAHQTATTGPEDFIERFSERIRVLSANQDLLIRNEWQGAEIEDIVRAQLAPFADFIGSRIAVHGPRICLNAASAQLALHELATNASK